ncbi:hypothetical protein HQ308_18930 [Rhodococcus sp. BP-241]|uniref:ArnT family glycosyltransferase n=1 Tax=Rhodococcus sp. BP-241 TaxID=2739441 RepID=UPI001C9A8B86|nr:hypothetical protein [Rhodococcus sp. BP-241]MBY6708873.1 hypothetical protein [Rhodococcus sp. BP-241]
MNKPIGLTGGHTTGSPGIAESVEKRGTIRFLMPILGVLVSCLTSWLTHDSLTDDAYITLAAARNLAENLHWGVIDAATANTSTSPLNVLLLGSIAYLTRVFDGSTDPQFSLYLLNALCGALIGWALGSIARSISVGSFATATAILLVQLNPFVLSAIGLEVLLIPAVLLSMTALGLRMSSNDRRAGVQFGLATGAAVLTRLDLVVFAAAFFICAPAVRAKWKIVLPAALIAGGPWFMASWLWLGSAIPDTFLIKEGQATDVGGYNYATGPEMFAWSQPLATSAAFIPALLGLAITALWLIVPIIRHKIPVALWTLGFGGVAYYGAYSALNTVPYHWYYVTPLVSLTTVAILGTVAVSKGRTAVWPFGVIMGTALLALTVTANSQNGFPWRSPVIFGNWASAQDYARVGGAVGQIVGDSPVRSPGEIGTLAYFCDCTIVDEFSDRGLIIRDRLLPRLAEASGVERFLLRLNYSNLDYSQQPITPAYRLDYVEAPDAPQPPLNGARQWVWPVYSASRGDGFLILTST